MVERRKAALVEMRGGGRVDGMRGGTPEDCAGVAGNDPLEGLLSGGGGVLRRGGGGPEGRFESPSPGMETHPPSTSGRATSKPKFASRLTSGSIESIMLEASAPSEAAGPSSEASPSLAPESPLPPSVPVSPL